MLMNSLFACSATWAWAINRALRSRSAPSVENCRSDWTAAGSNGSSVLRPIASSPIVSPPTASGATRKRLYGCTTDSRPSGAPVYSAVVSSTGCPLVTPASTLGISGQQGQCREVRRGEGAILVAAEHQHADSPPTVDEGHDRHVAHVGERLAELGRGRVGCQATTERRLQRVDRLLHQRLSCEVVKRIPLPDPCQLPGLAIRRFDDDVVVDQAREGGPVGVHRMSATLQDAGDDLPWVERPGDVEGDLDELAKVLVWLLRQHPAGKITASANALAGRQGEERCWLAALGGLLQPLDDPT